MTRYEVECQDEATHGRHEATFSHVNEYSQKIYTVVCDGYEERYTEEVVIEVKDAKEVTRTVNPNGTYRYEIDGELANKASKVLYTHATVYRVGDDRTVMFHKTLSAAIKARGETHLGWVKTAVLEIQDGGAS